ncbi:MAG: PAS domain S-box protein [Acidobacteriota bacterium]
MRLKSRLSLSIGATLTMGLILLAYTYTAMNWMHLGFSRINRYHDLSVKVSELGSLTEKYLYYPKERVEEQWRSVHGSVKEILSKIEPDEDEEMQLLNAVRKRHADLYPIFDSLTTPRSAASVDGSKERLSSHFYVQIRQTYDDVSRLIRMEQLQIESYQRRLTLYTVFIVMILLFSICIFLYFTNKEMVRSFFRLHEGTQIIGAGNPGHLIAVSRNDEIGELADSINRMTGRLRESTEALALAKTEAEKRGEWLRVVLTSIGDAVIATDTGGLITFLNPRAEGLTGWKAQDALGRPLTSVFRIVNEKSRQQAENPVEKVLRTGSVVELANHTVLIAADGSEIPIDDSAAPVCEADGTVSGVVLVFHDVTQKRRNQEKLRQSEAMLRAVLNQLPSGVTVRDAHTGELILSNAKAREITGNLAHDIGQFSRYRGFHSDGRPYLPHEWPTMRSMATGETIKREEMEYERPDGAHIILTFSVTPIRDSDGNIVLIASSFDDITERKRMEEELRRSHDELELRVRERTVELASKHDELVAYATRLELLNSELQEFAFVASHDLQEPLRKIQAFGTRLRGKYGPVLDEEGRDFLSRMESAASRMSVLLSDLLSYSRVATRIRPFTPLNLSEVARSVVFDLEVRIEESRARVSVDELPVVEADESQMRQLFQNLIGNALKYRKVDEPPAVRIHAMEERGACRLIVEDNGIGFDEKYLDRIFKPFQRLHGKSSPYEGTGMGLAICRKIVERHGGNITARSTPGEGSTFIITLPVKRG